MFHHDDLIEVFEDTQKFYEEDETLKKSVAESIAGTKIYLEGESPNFERKIFDDTVISVNKFRTFEAARHFHEKFPDLKISVLNFASATNPGGGVKKGSRAQEEALCRCSTLYPTLKTKELWKKFYNFHRERGDSKYTDACIYTPKIFVIKTDTKLPKRLPQEKWFQVDVLTCAAPNLRERPNNKYIPGKMKTLQLSDDELFQVHVQRAEHILKIAARHETDILILGAFGCGAFKNNPNVVAKAYKKVVKNFEGYFKEISFAVFCSPGKNENFVAFEKVFNARK